jgi:transposase-like protein
VLRAWFSRPEARVQAADLLREPGATVGAVARQVGYGTPFALSTAFKRARAGSARRRHPAGGCR